MLVTSSFVIDGTGVPSHDRLFPILSDTIIVARVDEIELPWRNGMAIGVRWYVHKEPK